MTRHCHCWGRSVGLLLPAHQVAAVLLQLQKPLLLLTYEAAAVDMTGTEMLLASKMWIVRSICSKMSRKSIQQSLDLQQVVVCKHHQHNVAHSPAEKVNTCQF